MLEREIEPVPTDAQQHQNFLYSMHEYFRRVLVRHNKVESTQKELEEAAQAMELVEPILNSRRVKHPMVSTFEAVSMETTKQIICQALYSSRTKAAASSTATDVRPSPKGESGLKRIEAIHRDYTKIKCYNYNQLGHLFKDCLVLQKKQKSAKPLGKKSGR